MYYGWYVVIYSGFIYALILGSTYSAFGLFVLPVSSDLKLSRADINSAMILLNVGNAILAPLIGRMLDRIPARRIMIVSALLAGLSFSVLSFSTSLWLSAIILAVPLAVAVLGAGTLTMSVILARWFTVHRGRAMLLAYMGASLGGIVIVPAIGWLLERESWRTTLLVIGGIVTGLLLILALTIRERPRPGELESSPARPANAGDENGAVTTAPASVGSLLAMPQFWTIGLSCALAMAMAQTILITIVPLAVDAGLTTFQAAGLISITSVAAIASKLLLAIVADRFDRIYLLTGLISLLMIVNILLLLGDEYPILMACAVMLGMGSSAMLPILNALLVDRFGLSSFGTVGGLMVPLIAVLGAVAMRTAGEVFDRLRGYDYLFYGFIVVGLFAVALMLATKCTRQVAAAEG